MKYIISVFYADAEVEVKTNDVEIAILEMLNADHNGNHAHVCDGETGEVLAIINDPEGEDYSIPEFALMVLGFLCKMEQEAEEEPEEPAPQFPIRERQPSIFEVMSALSAQQMLEFAQTPEGAFMFPFVCPSDEDSEIVS